MKTEKELEDFIQFINNSYKSSASSMLSFHSKKFTGNELGYCYKYTDESGLISNYNVFCFETNYSELDIRVKAHEYGHIYLAHLDGLKDELDKRAKETVEKHKQELIDLINKECGISWGDKLLDSLFTKEGTISNYIHNIAMDMEVNSSILSLEDIDFMEKILSNIQYSLGLDISAGDVEATIEGEMNKNKRLVKLIHPNRYHVTVGIDAITNEPREVPFPAGLTYEEYLIMIVKHLDQFIKMMVSISSGKNGDTSGMSSEQVKDFLDKLGEKGQSIDGIIESELGEGGDEDDHSSNSKGNNNSDSNSSNNPSKKSDNGNNGESSKSNGSKSRGTGDGGYKARTVEKHVDPVSNALNEVINDLRNRAVVWSTKKDMMRNYNRGSIRSVIAPAIVHQYSISNNLKIAYLIDTSGSMDDSLIDRCIRTISEKMKKINGGLKYDIISCDTAVRDVYKDIDPRKSIPEISSDGGTRISKGINYFRNNYSKETTLVIISDFEDNLKEWQDEFSHMKGYKIYGFNYGCPSGINWKYLKERNFRR